jgi:ferredoxin
MRFVKVSEITGIYFSPTGHSRMAVQEVVKAMGGSQEEIDLTLSMRRPEYHFTENEAVVVGVPVYAGRVPDAAAERLKKLHGRQTPAVLLVTYGNRAYDDALAELQDILKAQGFQPVAAAAVAAQHSIVKKYAANRPDASDLQKLDAFAARITEKLRDASCNYDFGELKVPGGHPQTPKPASTLKIKVTGSCDNCGICIRECPVQAISRTDPKITDAERCISCMRCVEKCPSGGRKVSSLMMMAISQMLKKSCSVRKEPEFFYQEARQ